MYEIVLNRMRHLQLLLALLFIPLVSGCSTTWGYKMPMGPNRYKPTRYEQVLVLWSEPKETFDDIGICSVLGGASFITADSDMLRKLQKSAADLGADAVIVVREGTTKASMISGGGGGSGYVTPSYGQYSSGWGMSGSSFEYPRNTGRAIKYKDPKLQRPTKQ